MRKYLRKVRDVVVAVLPISLLIACSSKPTIDISREAVEAQVRDRFKGASMEFGPFLKTNGLSSTRDNVEIYDLEFVQPVRFPDGNRPECIQKDGQFAGFNCMMAINQGLIAVSPNTTAYVFGSVNLIKKEAGWVTNNVNIRDIKACHSFSTQQSVFSDTTNVGCS